MKIKSSEPGRPASREEIEAELKRRGWRYVAPDAVQFKKGRWQPMATKGLWFRPEKQAELNGRGGLLFVNAAIEEGLGEW